MKGWRMWLVASLFIGVLFCYSWCKGQEVIIVTNDKVYHRLMFTRTVNVRNAFTGEIFKMQEYEIQDYEELAKVQDLLWGPDEDNDNVELPKP